MLPGGSFAAAFVLSLIPGWLFLRLTAASRKPRAQSSLHELLEVVAVGAATTGLAFVFWVWVDADAVLAIGADPTTGEALREAVTQALRIFGAATVLSTAAGIAFRLIRKEPYSIGVWWEVLTKEHFPSGHLAHVAIVIGDGTTIDGVLDTYTWSDEAAHRDVALKAPIGVTTPKGRLKPGYDRVVIPGSEIKHLAVRYMPENPG